MTSLTKPNSACAALYTNTHFNIEPCGTCTVPGYLVVMPWQSVTSLSQLSSEALVSLGPTLALATRAVEAVVRPERVYCALFSEQTKAIHFHIFPRTAWLTAKYAAAHPNHHEISGPRLMDWAREVFQPLVADEKREEILEKIRDKLRVISTARSLARTGHQTSGL